MQNYSYFRFRCNIDSYFVEDNIVRNWVLYFITHFTKLQTSHFMKQVRIRLELHLDGYRITTFLRFFTQKKTTTGLQF